MSVLSSPAYQYLLHYKLSIPKFLPAPISPMFARSLQKNSSSFQNSLSSIASSATTKKFYKQLQGATMGSPVSPVITNIYMEYFESLAIPTSLTLIKWSIRYVDDVYSATRKDQVNKLQEHLCSIDPHIKFTTKLSGTNGLHYLDTLTKPTPKSIESTTYRKTTCTDRYLDYNSNHPHFSKNYLLSTPSSTELNMYVQYLNSLQNKQITFTKSYHTTTTKHHSFNKANHNRKPLKSQTHPQESL